MHISKKKLLKCRAVFRSRKNFLLRAVAGPRSGKKIKGKVFVVIHHIPKIGNLFSIEFMAAVIMSNR